MENEVDKKEEKEIHENKMGYMPIGRLIVTMSWPAVVSMLVQACYNVVDSIFVARVGEKALTAVTLAFPLQFLLIAVAVGTGIGINSLISRRLGGRFYDDANMAASMGIRLAVLTWLVFAVIGITSSEFFMKSFSDDPYIIEQGKYYITICLSFSLFCIMQVTAERIIQATGNMLLPMLSTLTGAIVNIILDPIFIFGYFGIPRLEAAGAAIATVIGQACGCVLAMLILIKKDHQVEIKVRGIKWDKGVIKDIYAVGAPSIVMQTILSVVQVCLNSILAGLSMTAVAVLGVYGRLQSFIFMPVFGINQGSMPVMGYNYGARNMERFKSAYFKALMIAVIIMSIGLVIFQIFPRQLLTLFSATESMYEMGENALRIISLCFLPASFGIISAGAFQATGHGIISMMGTLLRQFLGVLPVALILSRIIGVDGVWWAFPAAEIIGFIYMLIMIRRLIKKDMEKFKDEKGREKV